jgi:outer membrane protein
MAALAGTAAFTPVRAEEPGAPPLTDRPLQAGDILLRARISGIVPYDVMSEITVIGGQVDVPRMVLPDIDVTYFLTDRWAVTGQAGALMTKVSVSGTVAGDIDVGSIWAIPVALSLEYHLLPEARFSPYIAAGFVATWYTGARPASSNIPAFSVDSQVSPTLRAGFDYQIQNNWFANVEVKQVLPPTQVMKSTGTVSRTDLKTISLGLGIGYRF